MARWTGWDSTPASGMRCEHLGPERLAARLGIDGLVVMYVGNLEPYQGIDLLLQSFARLLERTDRADLVIFGGAARDMEAYRGECQRLRIVSRAHFHGPRLIAQP